MMKRLIGSISSLFVICLILAPAGKAQSTDSLAVEDTSSVMPFVSAVSPYFDYGKVLMIPTSRETKYELGVQVELLNKIFLVTEFGYGELVPPDSYTNANYTSSGNYMRIGAGYKIDMSQKFNMGISGRYARSWFSDQGNVQITSNTGIFDDFTSPFKREDLSASWYEVVLHSEQRLWNGLYCGLFIRLRIMDKYDKQTPLDVYSVPGYGRTFDQTVPAFNLYLKYAFENF